MEYNNIKYLKEVIVNLTPYYKNYHSLYMYDYIVNTHKYIREMHPISDIHVQFINRQFYTMKNNKIKNLSDGIVD